MPLEHIELAKLNVPDDPQTRARFAELTHPRGVELQPAETYEAHDPGGLITVTVNKSQKVTNVRIRPRWYEQLRPDAILLDLDLPRISGYEVARRVRNRPDLRATLLIALSGHEGDEAAATAAGFNRYVRKPVAIHTLERMLA